MSIACHCRFTHSRGFYLTRPDFHVSDHMIKGYLKIIKKLNNAFIVSLLYVLYFPIVGICYLLFLITKTTHKKAVKNTYWETDNKQKFTKEYFQSIY